MSVLRSQIVVDLGFGDSGKGLVVDSLCENAARPLVVRYTGGPQAGHTVIRDGNRHVFSSFGSGTLQGVPSFFGPETLIYLPNLIREYRKLQELNGPVPIKLYIDPRAKVITPSDVALGRIKEKLSQHGSCGIGIGAAMTRNEYSPHRIPAGVIPNRQMMILRKEHATRWAVAELNKVNMVRHPWTLSEFEEELDHHMKDWTNAYESFVRNKDFEIVSLPEAIAKEKAHMLIFEGAQGVMLDRDFGCFPNVTYGYTTSRNAWKLLDDIGLCMPADVVYVHRCYTTRHGHGWMPSEWSQEDVDLQLGKIDRETNVTNQWQGNFRYGDLDLGLIKSALEYDRSFHPLHAGSSLVMTCLDQRPEFKLPKTELDTWGLDAIKVNSTPLSGHIQSA